MYRTEAGSRNQRDARKDATSGRLCADRKRGCSRMMKKDHRPTLPWSAYTLSRPAARSSRKRSRVERITAQHIRVVAVSDAAFAGYLNPSAKRSPTYHLLPAQRASVTPAVRTTSHASRSALGFFAFAIGSLSFRQVSASFDAALRHALVDPARACGIRRCRPEARPERCNVRYVVQSGRVTSGPFSARRPGRVDGSGPSPGPRRPSS